MNSDYAIKHLLKQYFPLFWYLWGRTEETIELNFDEIERILKEIT